MSIDSLISQAKRQSVCSRKVTSERGRERESNQREKHGGSCKTDITRHADRQLNNEKARYNQFGRCTTRARSKKNEQRKFLPGREAHCDTTTRSSAVTNNIHRAFRLHRSASIIMRLTTSIQVIVAVEPGLNLHGTGCPFSNVLVSNTRASAGFVQLPDENERNEVRRKLKIHKLRYTRFPNNSIDREL